MSKVTDERKVIKIKDNGGEEPVAWNAIKAGMKIKVFEANGDPVVFRGWDVLVALADAKLVQDDMHGAPITVYVPELDETQAV